MQYQSIPAAVDWMTEHMDLDEPTTETPPSAPPGVRQKEPVAASTAENPPSIDTLSPATPSVPPLSSVPMESRFAKSEKDRKEEWQRKKDLERLKREKEEKRLNEERVRTQFEEEKRARIAKQGGAGVTSTVPSVATDFRQREIERLQADQRAHESSGCSA